MEKRVTVRVEHRRKTFFIKFLEACRQISEDSHQKFVYYKAINGMKQYPLEVNNITDLKNIAGIGETIAVRCEAAWDTICSDLQSDLSLKEVKELQKEDFVRLSLSSKQNVKKKKASPKKQKASASSRSDADEFVEPARKKAKMGRSTSTMDVFSSSVTKRGPALPRSTSTRDFSARDDDVFTGTKEKPFVAPKTTSSVAVSLSREFIDSDDDIAIFPVDKGASNKENKNAPIFTTNDSSVPSSSRALSPTFTNSNLESLDSNSSSSNEVHYITCHPRDQAEVILICDTREDRKKKRRSNVVDVLVKNGNFRMETRVLAVGDFLWIARKIDGSEMVLDWVVERKTWDDLDSSIRKGRYDEQKQRLCRTPIPNRVYLLEDRGRGEVAAEQALATTRTRDGFMIQRCENGHETAQFLESVSRRLQAKLRTQRVSGIRFGDLQLMSQKGQVGTVKNVWVEQLTVCPGMSSTRALTVADSFPSFKSLADFYASSKENNKQDLLNQAIPQVPKPVSARIAKFFA